MDALKRAFRTFLQGAVGAVSATQVMSVTENLDISGARQLGLAALAGGLAAVVSWAQNALEVKTGTNLLPK